MSHQRKVVEKRRLRNLYSATSAYKHLVGGGANFSEEKDRIIRTYGSRAKGASLFFKKKSNKKVRRQKEALQGSDYRKVFDYQWKLH